MGEYDTQPLFPAGDYDALAAEDMPDIIAADEARWGDVPMGSTQAFGFSFGGYTGEVHPGEGHESYEVHIYGSEHEPSDYAQVPKARVQEINHQRSATGTWAVTVLEGLRRVGKYTISGGNRQT